MVNHIIFGGSGFTGRHLSQALSTRGEVQLLCDIEEPSFPLPLGAKFLQVDITKPQQLAAIPAGREDIVYNLAARQFHNRVPTVNQDAWFNAVNVKGTENILHWMAGHSAHKLITLSTDMVYGVPQKLPVPPSHPRNPLGPYGRSKLRAEDLCTQMRKSGASITVLRPRMIVGPGRLGILIKLFDLMRRNLPIPMIGNGKNHYQMISVHDVITAILASTDAGFPNIELNLGSSNPPTVRDLLEESIRLAHSNSRVFATPARPLKWVLAALERLGHPLLHREQYGIADINYLVDIEPTRLAIGWSPKYSDTDMLFQAYEEYRSMERN